ncbi:hypothetical protein M409DRAFT_21198 [Zasmidium cellare ATCC 36951]|uniref:Zn(2)-C6 fungal-type domain-containing protein n=1 Tax=Zasmidium cellare ATCC 36951 TaxID=1080233 RepID=A0A6A6CQF1_ZASCE|nr:uncharacterized protein M409DRAFT_21198 [Zasmidium cellare ATCC 36951]KAF2168448.1 hypothetical protein M409DRAFT_21198 [Zasmidium cellare ATCC 36951]
MSQNTKIQQKPQRLLACVRCQQRKVKCDRSYPCSNCVRVGVQAECTPASLAPRQRKRRFPERYLLQRVRQYESLLRQHNIPFEPLHPSAASEAASEADHEPNNAENTGPTPESIVDVRKDDPIDEKPGDGIDIWQVMNHASSDGEFEEDEDDIDITHIDYAAKGKMRYSTVKKALDQLFHNNDLLFFGSSKSDGPLSTLHPPQVHIFRLWQIYLDNVNPILKVTHTPTLQSRLLDAAADVTSIHPPLEALMFSIYCVAIVSLQDDECKSLFASPKEELLSRYQLACQQSLQNCRILRATDLDCLVSLFLYLVSVRSNTDPRSLGALLGVAIRLAQRMGIHTESSNAKCSPFEAELHRRLWWALVLFDNRICEMSDMKATMLAPTWNCKPPLNVNDFDIRPEMTSLPTAHRIPTEALYAVVCSELGNHARHSASYLDCNGPTPEVWKGRPNHTSRTLDEIHQALENKYFSLCNPENPIHYLTIWTARGFLAKYRLYEHYSLASRSQTPQTTTQRDAAIIHAITILDCDTRLASSLLTKGFFWQLYFNFPFPSYMHIVSDLQKRPLAEPAERAWRAMSENCEARFKSDTDVNLGFKLFSRSVLQAWEAREKAVRELGNPIEVLPSIVEAIQRRRTGQTPKGPEHDQQLDDAGLQDFEMPVQMDWSLGLPGMMDPLGTDMDFSQFFDWDPASSGWAGLDGV